MSDSEITKDFGQGCVVGSLLAAAIAAVMALAGLLGLAPEAAEVEKPATTAVIASEVRFEGKGLHYIWKFKFEDHDYLFMHGHAKSGLEHDPNCNCFRPPDSDKQIQPEDTDK